MGLIKFKQIKPLKFEMRARYWDPVKEQREARLKEIKAMQDDSIEAVKTRISRRFQGKYNEYYSEKTPGYEKAKYDFVGCVDQCHFCSLFFSDKVPTCHRKLVG